ncbi:MAG: hypothetical protein M1831_007134 [Alyxoria varia]|nr:MAG: hypothetical protein M1831_007134 [Alyxoria varia]
MSSTKDSEHVIYKLQSLDETFSAQVRQFSKDYNFLSMLGDYEGVNEILSNESRNLRTHVANQNGETAQNLAQIWKDMGVYVNQLLAETSSATGGPSSRSAAKRRRVTSNDLSGPMVKDYSPSEHSEYRSPAAAMAGSGSRRKSGGAYRDSILLNGTPTSATQSQSQPQASKSRAAAPSHLTGSPYASTGSSFAPANRPAQSQSKAKSSGTTSSSASHASDPQTYIREVKVATTEEQLFSEMPLAVNVLEPGVLEQLVKALATLRSQGDPKNLRQLPGGRCAFSANVKASSTRDRRVVCQSCERQRRYCIQTWGSKFRENQIVLCGRKEAQGRVSASKSEFYVKPQLETAPAEGELEARAALGAGRSVGVGLDRDWVKEAVGKKNGDGSASRSSAEAGANASDAGFATVQTARTIKPDTANGAEPEGSEKAVDGKDGLGWTVVDGKSEGDASDVDMSDPDALSDAGPGKSLDDDDRSD